MSLIIPPIQERNFQDLPRIIILSGDVDENLHSKFIEAMVQLEHISNDPIHLHISSYGGSVYEMFGIIDIIRNAKSPIYTVCTGKSMSAAVPILAAGQKGQRKIGKYSTVMLHEVSGFGWGKTYAVKNEVVEQERVQDLYLDILSKYTNLPLAKIRKIFDTHKDTYLSADDVIGLKIADDIF